MPITREDTFDEVLNGLTPGTQYYYRIVATNYISTSYGLLDPNPVAGETLLPRNFGRGPGWAMLNLKIAKVARRQAGLRGAADELLTHAAMSYELLDRDDLQVATIGDRLQLIARRPLTAVVENLA